MKKILGFVLAAITLAACSSDREHILKIYNWADYIDEDLIGEFEQWYREQTGESVKIVYQTFDINETMLSKIEKGEEDYDAVCPSDYIIERMMRKDLLLPIDKNFGNTPNYIDGSLSPYIVKCFNKIDGHGKNANDYAVGYMWGTTGFLYNTKYVSAEDVKTWDVLRNPKYKGKIFVKDAPRDIYGPVLIYLKQNELKEGKVTLDELMYDSSDASIAAAENYLRQIKEQVAGWEADFGKEQMTQERGYINLTWSGDAKWAIDEAAQVGVSLDYIVPEEGSTVWFDGWVIPKYAKNVKAARYFINFMCKPENAVRNSEKIGYVSACGAPELLEAFTDESCEPQDLRYFFGEAAGSVRVNHVLYADRSIIENCTMEHDWGEDTAKLISMWSRVKGENANAKTFVIVGAVVLLVIGFTLKKSKNSRKSRKHARK